MNKTIGYVNGKIYTADPDLGFVDSIAVRESQILYAGPAEQMPQVDEIVDLGGRTVIPGIIDAHMHPTLLADFSKQIACLPPKVNSLEELAEEIARVRAQQSADEWILGWGYDEGKLAEHRAPNRYDLDKGADGAPVYMIRSDEHIRCVNSAALKLAGITRDTEDPPGGVVEKDENGEPTGILKENAKYLIAPYLPQETFEGQVENVVDLGRVLASQGVTAVADMGNLTSSNDNYPVYMEAASRGFRQHVSIYYMWDFYENDPEFTIPKERRDGSAQIHAAGLKLIGDGTPSGLTAWGYEPFLGSDNCGMPVYSDESYRSALDFVRKEGLQLSVHCMGARAIDRIVDAVKDIPKWNDDPDVPDIRIEHVTEPTEDALRKAAERGIFSVSQPIFAYCEIETYLANLGPERTKTLYPYRSMLDAGVPLAFSSDSPATSWATPSDPFPSLASAVTRLAYDGTDLGQDQRVSMETAISLYTREAAKVCGFKDQGMLRPGYSASFVVLSDDLFTVPAEQICEVHAEQTYIDGELVYQV